MIDFVKSFFAGKMMALNSGGFGIVEGFGTPPTQFLFP